MRTFNRRALLGLGGAVAASALLLGGCSSPAPAPISESTTPAEEAQEFLPVLRVGHVHQAVVDLVEQAGIFDDAPYDVEWNVSGISQQAGPFYADQLDVAFYGVTNVINQQGAETADWTAETVPVKLILGLAPDHREDYPSFVTVGRVGVVDSLDDVAGKNWAYASGGDNYPTFLASVKEAGLEVADVNAIQLDQTPDRIAAWQSGQVDVYTGFYTDLLDDIRAGKATVIADSYELGVPVFWGFAAKTERLADPTFNATVDDFLQRFVLDFWQTWWPAHHDEVIAEYVDVLKTSEAVAEYNFEFYAHQARLFDSALFDAVLSNAALLYDAGSIPLPITDASIYFYDDFNRSLGAVSLF